MHAKRLLYGLVLASCRSEATSKAIQILLILSFNKYFFCPLFFIFPFAKLHLVQTTEFFDADVQTRTSSKCRNECRWLSRIVCANTKNNILLRIISFSFVCYYDRLLFSCVFIFDINTWISIHHHRQACLPFNCFSNIKQHIRFIVGQRNWKACSCHVTPCHVQWTSIALKIGSIVLLEHH